MPLQTVHGYKMCSQDISFLEPGKRVHIETHNHTQMKYSPVNLLNYNKATQLGIIH